MPYKYDDVTGTINFVRYTDLDGTVIYEDEDGDTFLLHEDRFIPHTPILSIAKDA